MSSEMSHWRGDEVVCHCGFQAKRMIALKGINVNRPFFRCGHYEESIRCHFKVWADEVEVIDRKGRIVSDICRLLSSPILEALSHNVPQPAEVRQTTEVLPNTGSSSEQNLTLYELTAKVNEMETTCKEERREILKFKEVLVETSLEMQFISGVASKICIILLIMVFVLVAIGGHLFLVDA